MSESGYSPENKVLHLHGGGLPDRGPYAETHVADIIRNAFNNLDGSPKRLDILTLFQTREGNLAGVEAEAAYSVLARRGLELDAKRYYVVEATLSDHRHQPPGSAPSTPGTWNEKGYTFTIEEGPMFK